MRYNETTPPHLPKSDGTEGGPVLPYPVRVLLVSWMTPRPPQFLQSVLIVASRQRLAMFSETWSAAIAHRLDQSDCTTLDQPAIFDEAAEQRL